MLDAISEAIRWWEAVELWLTQIGLAFQVALLMLVLLPACWWAAQVIDRVSGVVFERLGHRYTVDTEDAEGPR